ncbi:sulfur oxidation c-type cytochrome SoxA [Ponticoccus sp. SC2-23]|uniref:sulfur oxidation c-type cytochrome SoxA n=1 Tax=Alexandriicola marinus TaxID=2081710 RepID=UPI000FD862BC|nr:sulfur oxidation c-type cytochrome SoxA [Alexandriicola marinus]MBM1220225.1 sulfur oxidation c-type cytochrome SoxA [Ponticoccus sp. SC6-9]MBM1224911.1 sulfur oxidation c-type cytochrome SoxA [Ponticoccus sp. SC6-15]MBM1228425.1 sulfur oxidation c-type cytochrome SoxA [Ponticoccus sp. SC6-38]MBM1233938.1 sulfur oxidation c-type cytochrome SoxA [Ponticoccus sp. SC6-45]MBM1238926.1 sulfur oxidation c-type cytochrome SoxA [Ponticoccus sp. SC6-49]MBM1242708.1 sulfur oxidation c-type cytochrom
MTKRTLFAGLLATGGVLVAGLAQAQDIINDELVINGDLNIVTQAPAADHLDYMSVVRSGWTFRSTETQAMQMDDFDNPGMLGVESAMSDFTTAMGADGESCASCHDGPESLSNVRATYPQWDEEHGEVQTVEMQVNECITERMGAEPWGYNSTEMINMSGLISWAGRGEIVDIAIDGPAQETWQMGKDLYYTRTGQLELSCANCHEDNYDNYIRADHLSMGMLTGFPTYRLKDARLVSVHSRFRGCIRDTRAETYAVGSPEFVALELYVMSRGNGLSVEGPAVRN